MPTLYIADRMWVDTVDPTVNDDASNGFDLGAEWLNTSSGQFFNCCDNTTGAAVWDGEPRNLTLTLPWTPTITGSTGSTGIAYTTQIGYYQRVNNLVQANFYILLSSKGTASGTVQIANFPIANNSSTQSAKCAILFTDCTLSSGYTHMSADIAASAVIAPITEVGSGVQQAYDFANAMNTSSFSGTLIYQVD